MDVQIIGRMVERLIVVLTGTLTIYLGYKLFMARILHPQNAEFSKGGWKLVLKGVGPGILFSLFGAVIVFGSWMSALHTKTTDTTNVSGEKDVISKEMSYAKDSSTETLRRVHALNTAIKLSSEKEEHTQGALLQDLQDAGPTLMMLRNAIITDTFGTINFDKWDKMHVQYLQNSKSLGEADRNVLDKMRPWFMESFVNEH